MRGLRYIARIAFVVLLFVATSVQDAEAAIRDYAPKHHDNSATIPLDDASITHHVAQVCLASETPQVPCSSSLTKTIQRTHSGTNYNTLNLSVIRSVKSATYASRYGLCNHKILFSMYARHYYINGLRHLII